MSGPHVLVVGAGSAGRRHARNLASLGASVSVYDPRADRRQQARRELPALVEAFDSWDRALDTAFGGVAISSPPHVHVAQALAFIERRVPVLLEKPVSPELASAQRLSAAVRESGVPLLLGYTYRWWPPFLEMKRRLDAGVLGAVRHARFMMSAHLADWHPWERYQDFFMARAEEGGGALLDESHFLDLALWLFGPPRTVYGRAEKTSSLEISADDNVDVVAVHERGLRVTVHLDLYGRPHEKSVTVVGEGGTLRCVFEPNVLQQASGAGGPWDETPFACERNDMFLAAAAEFLEVAAGRRPPSCTVEDGVNALRYVEAVRRSTAEGRAVPLERPC